jgi:hypothetical protein
MKPKTVWFALGTILPVVLCLCDVVSLPVMLTIQLVSLVEGAAYRIFQGLESGDGN